MSTRLPRRRALSGAAALFAWLAAGQAARPRPAFAGPHGQDDDEPSLDPPGPGLPQPTETPTAGDAPPSDPSAPTEEAPADEEPAPVPPSEAPALADFGVPPVMLIIPALGVEAAVEPVGQDPDGAMSTPTDPDDVAWYAGSPGMGVPGNVVLAAHVNWDNRLRPFGLLHLLQPGDAVQVIDAEGRGFEYAVEQSYMVRADSAPVEDIFAPTPVPVVTLITCGGEYVAARREYLDRLIVRAVGV